MNTGDRNLNMSNYILINNNEHASLKLKPVNGYAFARTTHLVSVVLHEFPKISANYPMVFVKKPESGKYMPMALLGLEPGKNLFVDEKGQWLAGTYVPGAFRRHPFALTPIQSDEMALCIDSQSEFLSDDDGVALFGADGQPTEALEKIKNFVFELYKSELLSDQFCERLASLDLLVPNGFKVEGPEGVKHYDGSFIVDEQKLAALSAEDFQSLREQGYLVAIYAHLISLMQIEKFGALRTNEASAAR